MLCMAACLGPFWAAWQLVRIIMKMPIKPSMSLHKLYRVHVRQVVVGRSRSQIVRLSRCICGGCICGGCICGGGAGAQMCGESCWIDWAITQHMQTSNISIATALHTRLRCSATPTVMKPKKEMDVERWFSQHLINRTWLIWLTWIKKAIKGRWWNRERERNIK